VRPPKVPIGIFTLKNRTIGPVARLFVEYAREVARPLSRMRIVTMSVAGTKRTTPGRLLFVRFRGKSVKRRTGREAAMAAFAKSWRREKREPFMA